MFVLMSLSSTVLGGAIRIFTGNTLEAEYRAKRQAQRAACGLAFACRIQTLPKKTDAPYTAVIEYSCKPG